MGLLRSVHARDLHKQGLMHVDEDVEIVGARLLFTEDAPDAAAPALDGKPGSAVTLCFSPRTIVVWGSRLKGVGFDIRQLHEIRRFGNGEVELLIAHRSRALRRYGLRFVSEAAATETVERLIAARDALTSATQLSGLDADGLGRPEWAMITDVTTAAASPRVKAFGQALGVWADVGGLNYKRQSLYTLLLTKAACAEEVGDEPTVADLRELADDIHEHCTARYPMVTDEMLFGNVLVAFDLAEDGLAVLGPEANLARMAIVGSVLTHPAVELAALRPEVAAWVQSHPDEVRDSGF